MQRPHFESVRDYGARLTDAAYWRPYVEEVCRRHGLDQGVEIATGLPGTHPVFLVGGHRVIKFFSDLFSGEHSSAVERECYELLLQAPEIPGARLVAAGSLFPPENGWHWPYLVSTLLPGASLGELSDGIGYQERECIAQDLGRWLRQLHHLSLENAAVLRPDWTPFVGWLTNQHADCAANHRKWGSLPAHLVGQIDAYLHEVEALVDRAAPPLLLHCDLNADHLLGELIDGRWTTSGIIDFGDARMGDFHYELGALHPGLFRYDTRLLRIFLQAYGFDAANQDDFAQRAMIYTLLHEFNVLESISEVAPDLEIIKTLDELAMRIWI